MGGVIHVDFSKNGPLEQELTDEEVVQALDAVYEVFDYFFSNRIAPTRPAIVGLRSFPLRDLIEELRAVLYQGC